ncbi:Uncharacterized protein isoform A [Chlorella sorokiniana]|uniref:Uncharacterized protein isoform A n=1 Tax=Chlorella sorokiniana TaxID=3076 RepID=A0A2P6TG99_CHLSO|nr:Uncharacterized protein isoform A [Chlorella sorokiniana]|eukprot:PRW33136.1 Uncharacterized protein isoform A [Chlorella sorokiniana]
MAQKEPCVPLLFDEEAQKNGVRSPRRPSKVLRRGGSMHELVELLPPGSRASERVLLVFLIEARGH